MTTQIKAGVIAANAITASELASSALSGGSFTGDVTFDMGTLVVDSANNRVGIGETNPSRQFQISGTIGTTLYLKNSSSNVYLQLASNSYDNDNSSYIGSETNKSMSFWTVNERRMTIDASGKVGIGNTSPLGKLTISNAAGANAPETIAAANTYLQLGSDDYGTTGNGKFMIGFGYTDATNTNSPAYIGYEEASNSGDTYGDLTFYTRSVTTDTAPTERMRINSSGSVGIGYNVTSPVTTLEVSNTTNSQKLLGLFESQSAGRAVALGVTETGVGGNAAIYGTGTNGISTTENLYLNPDGGYVILGKRPVAGLGAKITADGNAAATTFRMSYDYGNATIGNRGAHLDFQIGNDSGSATKITTNYWSGSGDINITAYGRTSPHLYLKASTTDKVDSLGIGTINPQAQLHIDASGSHDNSSDAHVLISKNASNDWSLALNAGNDDYGLITSGYGSNAIYIYDYNASANRFKVTYSGVIYASNTTVQSISDERLKENIVDANSQWNDIKGLRFRNYNWIDNKYGDKTYLGLIAQELEPVCPNLVEIDPQPKEDIDAGVPDPEYKTVNYSIVWMKSVKALQEAMERIEQLEARLEEAGL